MRLTFHEKIFSKAFHCFLLKCTISANLLDLEVLSISISFTDCLLILEVDFVSNHYLDVALAEGECDLTTG